MNYTATCQGCGRQYRGERVGHCAACHQTFRSHSAAEDHRTGDFVPPEARRCRTPAEMRERGYVEHPSALGPMWGQPADLESVAKRRGVRPQVVE